MFVIPVYLNSGNGVFEAIALGRKIVESVTALALLHYEINHVAAIMFVVREHVQN